MSWPILALCGIGVLLVPATGRAAAAITCAKPVVTGASFTMSCAYAHQSMALTLVMRGTVEDDQRSPDTATATPTEIAILAGGKLRQTLTVESDGVWLNGLEKSGLGSVDLNFDSYDDLKVWTASSAGPNSGYAYWLYDPGTAAFERRQDLDDLLSGFDVTVDPATKTVSVSGRMSCCAWSVGTYHWVDRRLAQTRNEESGGLDLGDALADVAGIQAFRATSPLICATRTILYDDSGRITKEIIATEGDPCDDAQDYRKSSVGIDKSLNDTKRHGAATDVYRDGVLLQRTLIYDPPKAP